MPISQAIRGKHLKDVSPAQLVATYAIANYEDGLQLQMPELIQGLDTPVDNRRQTVNAFFSADLVVYAIYGVAAVPHTTAPGVYVIGSDIP